MTELIKALHGWAIAKSETRSWNIAESFEDGVEVDSIAITMKDGMCWNTMALSIENLLSWSPDQAMRQVAAMAHRMKADLEHRATLETRGAGAEREE